MCGPSLQFVNIIAGVRVVVGKSPKRDDFATEVRDRSPKRFRVTDPTKRGDGSIRNIFQACRHAIRAKEFDRGVDRLHDRLAGETRFNERLLTSNRIRFHLVATGQHDDTGATEFADRLTQQPAWEKILILNRSRGVQQYDVQIAGQSAVLKTVI